MSRDQSWYIASHVGLKENPKTEKLARLLGLSLVEAIGHLHCLWWWVAVYARDGCLAGREPETIATAALYPPERAEQFVDALLHCGLPGRAGFLEEREGILWIHEWFEYAGRFIRVREQNNERMRRWRQGDPEESAVDAYARTYGEPNEVQRAQLESLIEQYPAEVALKAVRWAIGARVRDTGRILTTAKKIASSNGSGVAKPVDSADTGYVRLGTRPSPSVLGRRS